MRFRRQRHPTEFQVTLALPSGDVKCKLTDISETGARLEGSVELVAGDSVTFKSSHGRALGIVKWANGVKIGVEFRPHISLQLVNALRLNGSTLTSGRFSPAHLREM